MIVVKVRVLMQVLYFRSFLSLFPNATVKSCYGHDFIARK